MRRAILILMISAVVPVVAVIGCQQQCFMAEQDFCNSHHLPLDAGKVDLDAPGCKPVCDPTLVRTVLHPEASERFISLKECIALALENGRTGNTAIRVLSYDPAIAYTDIEDTLSKFDTHWKNSLIFNQINERVGTALQKLVLTGANGELTSDTVNATNAVFTSQLEKQLPTGGTAGITFRTDYDQSNEEQEVNPAYRPRVILDFEQPLLQNFGVHMNQISSGILVSRVNYDEAHTRFAGRIQDLLLEVEIAYWNLYSSYWNFFNLDAALAAALKDWEKAKIEYDAGQVRIQNIAQLEQQYQSLRLQRLEALGGPGNSVLESERQLRFVVGLPPEDGCRLIPIDTPTVAPYVPDWCESYQVALVTRPELVEIRQELKKLQLDVTRAKNLALPDLRFVGSFDSNGLGSRLFGRPDNAFSDLGTFRNHDWSAGLTMDIPLGFRDAHSKIRRAQLLLAQRLDALHDQETQANFALERSYRELVAATERIRVQSALVKAATDQYKALKLEFDAGAERNPAFFIEARKNLTAALLTNQGSIFQYNIALADFERQKGTIMKYDNVAIAEGPLPACAQNRASAHIHDRERAIYLCDYKEAGPAHGACPAAAVAGVDGDLADKPPSIPTLMAGKPLVNGSDGMAGKDLPTSTPPKAPSKDATPPARPASATSPQTSASPYQSVTELPALKVSDLPAPAK
jgi:outer membrane protein TolC